MVVTDKGFPPHTHTKKTPPFSHLPWFFLANVITLMFYLSCPSAPLTINLRQCHYHHCHHRCYISVVIVFASAIINLNIWYTEPGQGLEFLDTPCIGQPEKDDSLISEQRHHWRQDPSTHPDNVLPWSTTAAGAVEPDQTNLIFSLTLEQQCVAFLPGRWESGIRGDMEGYLQSLPSSGRKGSAPFLWLFPFLWRGDKDRFKAKLVSNVSQ